MIPASKYVIAALALCLPVAAIAASRPKAANPSPENKRTSFSDFRVIQEKNIFNPNRTSRSGSSERRQQTRTSRFENLTLTGVMEYDKGVFAFFDGSRSDYRKVTKAGEALGDFKVVHIAPDLVKIAFGTNEFALTVGTQMRKDEGEPWRITGRVEFASSAPAPVATSSRPSTSTTTTQQTEQQPFMGPPEMGMPMMPMPMEGPFGEGGPPPEALQQAQNQQQQNGAVNQPQQQQQATPAPAASNGGSEDEVLRRLMQRREQELNQ